MADPIVVSSDDGLKGFAWRLTMRKGGGLEIELGDELDPRFLAMMLTAGDGATALFGRLVEQAASRLINQTVAVTLPGKEDTSENG